MTIERNIINLETPGILKQLSSRIQEDIDKYCIKTYDDGPRSHLGASIIGNSCSCYSWYTFRWIAHKVHTGRMYRLFNRGHREENRFCEWLRGIGFTVHEFADDGGQHRIMDCNGHFGGSLDGRAAFPEHYCINERILLEFKTSGTGQKFVKLKERGVKLEKEQHFAQMSTYGYKYNLRYALYMTINKNDDDLHCEVVELDHKLGQSLLLKAEDIINASTPPARLSQNPTYFECKWCDFHSVCHEGEQADRNCRSCVNAFPVENAEWKCSTWNSIIPKEHIKDACESWKSII